MKKIPYGRQHIDKKDIGEMISEKGESFDIPEIF